MKTMSPGLADFERGHRAHQEGRGEEAVAAYRSAIGRDPALAPAHFNLAQLLRERGDFAGAALAFDAAVRLRPRAADAWLGLGLCREALGDLETAARCYDEAGRVDPNSAATAQYNRGNVLRKQGDLAAAAHAFTRACSSAPDAAEVWLNLGNTLRELGRLEDAVLALERAVAIRPDWAEPRWNLGLAHLGLGRLAEGWAGYEHRWARAGIPGGRGLPWPAWQGEPLDGRTILVWREQGLGDEILFATCVADVVALGATVTLAVDPRLVSLYQRSYPDIGVVADGEWGDGPFDFQIPSGSLPGLLRRSRSDFRSPWSHLVPARERLATWARRLRPHAGTLKVGICWRSGLLVDERARSYPALTDWYRLLSVPGVTFVNLQYDDCVAELQQIEADTGARVLQWPDVDLRNDLEGVAALIWHLDLVVTAPTAVSSLAGALGTETWQIDPGTDWTVFGESRSPWLPAIRLFKRSGGTSPWSGVLDEVVAALRERAEAGITPSLEGK